MIILRLKSNSNIIKLVSKKLSFDNHTLSCLIEMLKCLTRKYTHVSKAQNNKLRNQKNKGIAEDEYEYIFKCENFAIKKKFI